MDPAEAPGPLPAHSPVHGHVLQRAVRPVRDAADVRLLPAVGAQLGVQEEGNSRRSEALQVRAFQTPN